MVKWEIAAKGTIEFIDLSCAKYEGENETLLIVKTQINLSYKIGYGAGLNLIGLYIPSERDALHEIGHSLGLMDEQCRPDRDRFINIRWDKIDSRLWFAFDYQHTNTYNYEDFPYDFKSIMHYDKGAWTDVDVDMGNDGLSPIDIIKIQSMYN